MFKLAIFATVLAVASAQQPIDVLVCTEAL